MPSFSPDVKKFPVAVSCTIFRVKQNPFEWNTFSEWYTRKTDQPQTLLGKSAFMMAHWL